MASPAATAESYQHVIDAVTAHWEIKFGLVALVIVLNLCMSRFISQVKQSAGKKQQSDTATGTDRGENQSKSILLVTAHPDDEVMFFGPALLHLQSYARVHLLCLSKGNADGLGEQRQKELELAWTSLGFAPATMAVLDKPQLQDGFDNKWQAKEVVDAVCSHGKGLNLTHLMTFDEGGASWHPNHHDTAVGVLQVATELDLPLLALTTVSLFRKYTGMLDLLLSAASEPRCVCMHDSHDKPNEMAVCEAVKARHLPIKMGTRV
eukprot:TRINITY_DN5500_c0_g1_i1.p1 TRINITY_DN5500_c0_g1~~TRINITY_DN5500_c0_g1_i1.p1  ORF type:complete len:264 (+),score=26.67 TRINITY_DN5500_c0_g1_i1:3-794(+)